MLVYIIGRRLLGKESDLNTSCRLGMAECASQITASEYEFGIAISILNESGGCWHV